MQSEAIASTLVSQYLVKADACQLESNSGSGSRPSRLLFALQVFDFVGREKPQLKEEFKLSRYPNSHAARDRLSLYFDRVLRMMHGCNPLH